MKQVRTLLMRALILAVLLVALSSSLASADPGPLGPGAATTTSQAVIPEDPGIPDALPEDPGIN
jgi:hypothetical protein